MIPSRDSISLSLKSLDLTSDVPPRLLKVLDLGADRPALLAGSPDILDGVTSVEVEALNHVDALYSTGVLVVVSRVVDAFRQTSRLHT